MNLQVKCIMNTVNDLSKPLSDEFEARLKRIYYSRKNVSIDIKERSGRKREEVRKKVRLEQRLL